jgi:phage terminase small subunit
MPPLLNGRHELFCLALAEGKSEFDAYSSAGYRPNRGNASRLKAKESVRARVAELQATAAKASEVTIQSLLNELEAARAKATDLNQLSAAVRAVEVKARVSGLLVQRIEQTVVIEDRYEQAETAMDAYRMLAADLADDVSLNEEELTEAAAMVDDFAKRMHRFVEGCRVKGLTPVPSQRLLTNGRSNGRSNGR